MNSKKIIVTGASGFIGSALVIALKKLNFNVQCMSGKSILKSQLKFIICQKYIFYPAF